MESVISLKPVQSLLGMNFYIPNYQRGYRWEKQQAEDLLEDLLAFSQECGTVDDERIYCIQPLVVAERKEDLFSLCKKAASIDEIRNIIKGSWTVVDGQQRLTTIALLLFCLDCEETYKIEYETRKGSSSFLLAINEKSDEEAKENTDYFHMKNVYDEIQEWLENHQSFKEKIKDVLLNRVNFIWYQIEEEKEIETFTRLNMDKIPLTDSELVKALFLNRVNFKKEGTKSDISIQLEQDTIALEWDTIEQKLQDDEFWCFLNDLNYSKPTRIDFILDTIYLKDEFDLFKKKKNNRVLIEGNDNHNTFRYFNKALKDETCIKDRWQEIKKKFQIYEEWYNDFRFYHYMGFLTTICGSSILPEYVELWEKSTKESFLVKVKENISDKLYKNPGMKNLENYEYDQEGKASKSECVPILLLHNIETIIQQNEKLVRDSKYNLPNFTKFPFHLYKQESWQVEHIRPNSGDNLKSEESRILYLTLAKESLEKNKDVYCEVEKYLSSDKKDDTVFEEILDKVYNEGEVLSDEEKNRIWNYTLLDESTNKEYGNQIFPVKRAFIANKEKGIKIKYSCDKRGNLVKDVPVDEIAFVPPCTKNVFSKFYTDMPKNMTNWSREDAAAYLADIKDKLKSYFKPEEI